MSPRIPQGQVRRSSHSRFVLFLLGRVQNIPVHWCRGERARSRWSTGWAGNGLEDWKPNTSKSLLFVESRLHSWCLWSRLAACMGLGFTQNSRERNCSWMGSDIRNTMAGALHPQDWRGWTPLFVEWGTRQCWQVLGIPGPIAAIPCTCPWLILAGMAPWSSVCACWRLKAWIRFLSSFFAEVASMAF